VTPFIRSTPSILLTSFATWRADQRSNASDDLVAEVAQMSDLAPFLATLRQLPVNTPIARSLTIYKFEQIRPTLLLCCGMAETRQRLSLETQAVQGESVLKTNLDLERLVASLDQHPIEISQDAGRFVCNSLYHAMLNYLKRYPDYQTLFVHVPRLTSTNRNQLVEAFRHLIQKLLLEVQ
jgi:pyroglutamyl-peptidase